MEASVVVGAVGAWLSVFLLVVALNPTSTSAPPCSAGAPCPAVGPLPVLVLVAGVAAVVVAVAACGVLVWAVDWLAQAGRINLR
jgi:hypothetical protein